MLEAFGKFTFQLHNKGIHFLDHSVGNTLIKIQNTSHFLFYLVDLNRMRFGNLSFKTRMANFERLSKIESHIKSMAKGYATASGEDQEVVFNAMKKAIDAYQKKFYRKKRWKNRLKV